MVRKYMNNREFVEFLCEFYSVTRQQVLDLFEDMSREVHFELRDRSTQEVMKDIGVEGVESICHGLKQLNLDDYVYITMFDNTFCAPTCFISTQGY